MKNVKEAPINMPDSNDDMSYVRGKYKADKTGAKYQMRLPSMDLGEIPGLSISHELMKDEDGNLTLYHSVDPYEDPKEFKDRLKNFLNKTVLDPRVQKRPLGMVMFTPYRDGYENTSLAVDPDQRRKGIAQKMFIALAKHVKKPIYFGKQQSADGKAFMLKMIQAMDKDYRVVGYDQQNREEFNIKDLDDLYTDPTGDPNKDLRNTKLIKLIPENYQDPIPVLEHIQLMKENIPVLDEELRRVPKETIGELVFNELLSQYKQGMSVSPRDKTSEFMGLFAELETAKIQNRRIAVNPDVKATEFLNSAKQKDILTLNTWLKTHKMPFKIIDVELDLTMPSKYGKNEVLVSASYNMALDRRGTKTSKYLGGYSESVIKEIQDQYPRDDELAKMIMRYLMSAQSMDPTKAKQIALQFHYTDWEFDNDMNSTILRQMGADPFEIDVATANEFMKQHNLPYRVRRMFLQGENLHFELDSNMTEASNNYSSWIKNIQDPKTGQITGQEVTKPDWLDKAIALKRANPRMGAKEIGRKLGGLGSTTISSWLTGTGTASKLPGYKAPFTKSDFPASQGSRIYFDGDKPEWYDKAVAMRRQGVSYRQIANQLLGSVSKTVDITKWLVKGQKWNKFDKNVVNPDAPFDPRPKGQKVDVNLINSLINDGLTDEQIIDQIKTDKGPKIANQVKTVLPNLRQKQNPGTQVIDKTSGTDISGFIK